MSSGASSTVKRRGEYELLAWSGGWLAACMELGLRGKGVVCALSLSDGFGRSGFFLMVTRLGGSLSIELLEAGVLVLI